MLRQLMRANIFVLTVSLIIWSLSMSVVFLYQSLYIQWLGGSKPVISSGGYVQCFTPLVPSMLESLVSGYICEINPMYPWYLKVVILVASLFLVARLVEEPKTAEV